MNRGCVRSANLPLGSEKYWPAYNLFRHKLMPDLFCAVPQDWPVPSFIEGSAWAFAGTISERTPAPAGLDWELAAASVRRSGFVMFQSSPTKPSKVSTRPECGLTCETLCSGKRVASRVKTLGEPVGSPCERDHWFRVQGIRVGLFRGSWSRSAEPTEANSRSLAGACGVWRGLGW